jgi:hypothetical protein
MKKNRFLALIVVLILIPIQAYTGVVGADGKVIKQDNSKATSFMWGGIWGDKKDNLMTIREEAGFLNPLGLYSPSLAA